jgi:hypothetical protein
MVPGFSVVPGHILLVCSLPFCIRAYRGYQRPLEAIVQEVLLQRTGGRVKIEDAKVAEEGVRRAIGSAVASRALGVATMGSIGVFGLVGALAFYASGCNTVSEAVSSTSRWGRTRRQELDSFFGVKSRVDERHPEVLVTRGMTEEEELEHISKTYFPDEDWEAEHEKR